MAKQKESVDYSKGVRLQKNFTLFQAIGICTGFMIGSGIFVSPYGVLMNVKSVGFSLVIWVICGFFNLIGALCYAELGTTFTRSGGEYTYIRAGFGDLPAFLCMWSYMVMLLPVATAATALIFATYLLQPLYLSCHPPDEAVRLVACLSILLLAITNCFNVRWAAKLQVVFAVSAVGALLTIVVMGFIALSKDQISVTFREPFKQVDYSPGSIALAFYSGFWSYSGWNCLNNIVDEMKNPHRDLPRAIVASVAMVTVIYIFANVAYMVVLSTPEMLSSTAVAVTFAERTMGRAAIIMPLFVACAIIGTMNGAILSVSRIVFIGAQDGNFPVFFSMIHYRWRTPIPALLLMSALSLGLAQISNIFTLIELVGFGLMLNLTVTYGSMLKTRFSRPHLNRPIKINISLPVLMFITCVLLTLITVIKKPVDSGLGLLVVASGIPLYIVGVKWRDKPKLFTQTFS